MRLAKVGLNIIEHSGFSRLKGIFRKGINYNTYEQIVGTAKNKTLGNIPKDMLDLIIRRNPQNKAQCIKTAQEAFENAAIILSEGEKLQRQAINRMRLTLDNTCKFLEDIERTDVYQDKLFNDKNAQMLCEAESEIYKKLQTLFPELGNVKLSLIGEGGFANVYRCQILDKSKQNIIADTVIKSYKSGTKNTELAFEKLNQMFDKYGDEEIYQYVQENGLNITKEQIGMTKSMVEIMSENAGQKTDEYIKYLMSMHGAKAESNISEILKYFSGHKLRAEDGIVIPHMFYLGENPFSISRYIDKNQSAKRKFDFSRLGLSHTDLAGNAKNEFNEICLDLGGIRGALNYHLMSKQNLYSSAAAATQSNIVGNKIATRILKHIHNLKTTEEILAYTKALEEYASKCKNELDKKTILETLKEIKAKHLYPKGCNTYKIESTFRKIEEEEIPESQLTTSGRKALKSGTMDNSQLTTRQLSTSDPQIIKLNKYGSL